MKAMHVAAPRGLFRGYDWVIRINPDVILYDEKPLFDLMENPRNWGVIATCYYSNRLHCNLTHTDFFAVRPQYVDEQAFADWEWQANNGG
eukprot:5977583-Pyramimonas_sp.AAC.1